jgi:hypothetical protein
VRGDVARSEATSTVGAMRRVALLLSLILVATACGDGDGDRGATPGAGDVVLPTGPAGPEVTVRVTGSLEQAGDGWVLCPGGVAPCWPVLDEGGLALSPQRVVAEGVWQADTIRLSTVEQAADPEPALPNPCARADLGRFDDLHPREGEMGLLIGALPTLAATWLSPDDDVLVVVVTGEVDATRDAIAALDVPGVCIADMGFEHTIAELESTQDEVADRLAIWGDSGWIATSLSIDVLENRLVATFDEIDMRLRTEVDERWGDLVRIDAVVEVLDGTVDALERQVPDSEIPIATQPRGSGGMAALGTFTLRYDGSLDCLWFESVDGERVKPIWPAGTRARRDPPVVLDGRGDAVVAVDQEIETGGGFGQVLADSDDPTDCGASTVWVISPY